MLHRVSSINLSEVAFWAGIPKRKIRKFNLDENPGRRQGN